MLIGSPARMVCFACCQWARQLNTFCAKSCTTASLLSLILWQFTTLQLNKRKQLSSIKPQSAYMFHLRRHRHRTHAHKPIWFISHFLPVLPCSVDSLCKQPEPSCFYSVTFFSSKILFWFGANRYIAQYSTINRDKSPSNFVEVLVSCTQRKANVLLKHWTSWITITTSWKICYHDGYE